jgi:hypothetical protein
MFAALRNQVVLWSLLAVALGAVLGASGHRLAAALLVVEGLGAGREVGSGAERPAGAGDDHAANGVVGIGDVEGGDHVLHHLGIERVQLLRPVQGDGRNARLHRIQQGLEGGRSHGFLLVFAISRSLTDGRSRSAIAPEQR